MSLVLARTLALAAAAALAPAAQAATQVVTFNVLNAAATLPTPLQAGDSLRLDTLVTTQTGSLIQDVTFTLAPGVDSFTGRAAWEISTAAGPGPRLVGVNIDIFDAANVLVASDAFAGTLAGFALSNFAGAIGPGTYRLHATGTGVRESSLDVTLSFLTAVPEPGTYAMFLAGLGVLVFMARRRA
jgi:hypothetical protein